MLHNLLQVAVISLIHAMTRFFNEDTLDKGPHGALMDMRDAMHDAVMRNPDVICVCFPRLGANEPRTSALVGALSDELEWLRHKGKAQPIVRQSFVVGVIRFGFIPNVLQ